MSDGFEHGYMAAAELKSRANNSMFSAARYIRRSMLKYSDLSGPDIDRLLHPDLDTPEGVEPANYVFGRLRGPVDEAKALPFPIEGLGQEMKSLSYDAQTGKYAAMFALLGCPQVPLDIDTSIFRP